MSMEILRKKTPEQLVKHIEKLKTEIADTVREKRTKDDTNIRKISNIKKEIARSMTVINEQNLDSQTTEESK